MARNTRLEDDYDEQSLRPAEKRRLRRQKARRRMIRRLIVMTLICALVVVAWTNWDTLAPDKLMDKFQDSFGRGAGSYPVDISGSNARRLVQCQNYTVLLSDSYLTFYDQQGGEVKRYASVASNALLRQAGRYVLLVEQGGTRLQLLTRTSQMADIKVDKTILSATVNDRGQIAVLTEGPQGYAVQLTVYSRQGKALYTRSRNHLAAEVALSNDGRQVALLSVAADNGDLDTTISVFDVRSTEQEAICTYVTNDVLLYRLGYLDNGWLAAIGEDGAVLLDTGDGLATVYTLGDQRLLGYAMGKNTLALVTREYGDTGNGQVHIVNKKGEPVCLVDFSGDFRHLAASDNRYVLLTDAALTEITASGGGRTSPVAADGQQTALVSGGRAVVMGLNMLQAYTMK